MNTLYRYCVIMNPGMMLTSQQTHDRMTGWACVNAIMAYLGEPQVLFGEFNDAADGHMEVDPVALAHRIRKWRRESALAAV